MHFPFSGKTGQRLTQQLANLKASYAFFHHGMSRIAM
jgi:hypothetical protein